MDSTTNRCRRVLGFHCRALGPFVLFTLVLTSCSSPDERLRVKVRGNLHKIETFLWGEISRLNVPSAEGGQGLVLPSEIGRHAKGAFLTPVPPRGNLETLLTASDGLIHEQYDVLADNIGYEQWANCCWGSRDYSTLRPEWMEIRGFVLSGPWKTLECMSLGIRWKGVHAAPSNSDKAFPIRKVTSESFCPPLSWQSELAP
jgi:hypothetical protein